MWRIGICTPDGYPLAIKVFNGNTLASISGEADESGELTNDLQRPWSTVPAQANSEC